MKIMFVCAAGITSGKERQTLDMMLFLRRRGHEIFCATASWGDGEFSRILSENNIAHQRMRLGYIAFSPRWSDIRMTLHQLIYVPSLWWNYRRVLSNFKPDVVVQSNFHHVLLLALVKGSPKQVFHVHEMFPAKDSYRRLFALFNRHVDLFIGVSKFICDNLSQLGIPPKKIQLVYNGVHGPSEFKRNTNKTPVIGIVGQVGPWKGHDVLIDAIQSLTELPWNLVIIGSGDEGYINSLKEKIARTGLADRVSFAGRRSGLENIYKDLDIVCVPSLVKESFGLVAAEPAFFEIPVIVTDRGGLPEIVVNNETGLVIPGDDVKALAGALRDLLTDEEKRQRFGRKARQHVNEKFGIEASGLQLENTLLALCEEKK